MAERADDLTQGFSTGQRKRVALARALLHDPEVLFLDEPTSGLDPAGTRDVIDLIQSLAGEGRTIVLATHFLGEAGRLADRMAVLHRGHLRAFGRPDELAAEIWQGIGAEIDLGGPAGADTLAALGRRAGRDRGRDARPTAPGSGSPTATCCPGSWPPWSGRGVPVYEVASRAPEPRGRLLRHRGPHPGRARRRRGHRRLPARPGPDGGIVTTTAATTPPGVADEPRSRLAAGPAARDWAAIRLVMRKDLTAVRRSKAIMLPMILVPTRAAGAACPSASACSPAPPPPRRSPTPSARPMVKDLVKPILVAARPRADHRAGARLPPVAAAAGDPAHGVGRAGRRRLRRREGAAHARGPALPAHHRPRPVPGQGAERLRARAGHHLGRARSSTPLLVQRHRLAGDAPGVRAVHPVAGRDRLGRPGRGPAGPRAAGDRVGSVPDHPGGQPARRWR